MCKSSSAKCYQNKKERLEKNSRERYQEKKRKKAVIWP